MDFHQIYSSDLSRAKETCQRIVNANGKSNTEITEAKLLREKCFGEAEDLHYIQFAYLTMIKNRSLPMSYVPQNGESKEDMQNRAKEFIQVNAKTKVQIMREVFNLPNKDTFAHKVPDSNPGQRTNFLSSFST